MKEYIGIIRGICQSLTEEYGKFNLFAIFEREDLKGKWDVVISIKLAPEKKNLLLKTVIDKFKSGLNPDVLITISRFMYLKPDHPFVVGINNAIEIENSDTEIVRSRFNNVFISHAFVFTSTRA